MWNVLVLRKLPAMPWWVWLLVAWAAVATVASLWLGAVAAIARRRERAARHHQYDDAMEQEWREAV